MGKIMKISCDACGGDITGQNYYCLTMRKYQAGKSVRLPTVYLCGNCFRKTKLNVMLTDSQGGEVEE